MALAIVTERAADADIDEQFAYIAERNFDAAHRPSCDDFSLLCLLAALRATEHMSAAGGVAPESLWQ